MPKRVLCLLAIVSFAFGSCNAKGGVTVTLDEYGLKPSPSSSKPGQVTFTARNTGEIAHQFMVLATTRAADRLPVSKGVVRTKAKGITVVDQIELVAPDDVEVLSVTLKPGRYVFICNIAGHYQSGMRAAFRVS